MIPNNLLLRLRSAPTCLSLSCAVPLDVALHAGPTDTQDEYSGHVRATCRTSIICRTGDHQRRAPLRAYQRVDAPEQPNGADLVPNGFDPDSRRQHATRSRRFRGSPARCWPERDGLIDWKSMAPRLGASWDVNRRVPPGRQGQLRPLAQQGRSGSRQRQPEQPAQQSLRLARLPRRHAVRRSLCQGLPANQVNGDLHFQPEEQGGLLSTGVLTPEQFVGVVTHDPEPQAAVCRCGQRRASSSACEPTCRWACRHLQEVRRRARLARSDAPSLRPDVRSGAGHQPARRPADDDRILRSRSSASVPTQTFLSNPPEAEGKYNGVEFVVRKRYANKWQLFGLVSGRPSEGNIGTHFNDGIGYTVSNPNQLINCSGRCRSMRRTRSS